MSKIHPIIPLPSAKYLRKCLDYDPENGDLRWKPRPKDHFASTRIWKSWNARYAGTRAGATNGRKDRYCISLDARDYMLHRVIWKMMTGKEPLRTIDHRDGNGFNNRWSNLRIASMLEQGWNRRLHGNNSTGYRGVSRYGRTRNWYARIEVDGIRHKLGVFPTREEASAAYEAAAREWHGEFYRHPRNYIPVSS